MVADDDLSTNPDAIVNPEHTRLRRIIQGLFRLRHAAAWRPIVEHIVSDLLDAMVAAGRPADLVRDYASLLPIRVMRELLDVPVDDQASLISWTGIFFATADVSTQDRVAAGMAFLTYVREPVAQRRATPGTGIVDELIAACDVEAALSEARALRSPGWSSVWLSARSLAGFLACAWRSIRPRSAMPRTPWSALCAGCRWPGSGEAVLAC